MGKVKVEALKQHLLQINPNANITAINKVYSAESSIGFNLDSYDYIVDAIDSLENKCNLILSSCKMPGKLYSSMGAALKLDPTSIQVSEFWKVKGCPLARAIRNKFKRTKNFPKKKFQCVFIDELLPNISEVGESGIENTNYDKSRANGSLCHITAIYGFTIAGLIIQDIQRSH